MVAYPFGYGLSYTDFEYSDFKLDKNVVPGKSDTITATVKVKNIGTVAGKEVVQLYLNASTWREEGRPKNELRAHGKTKLLAPGESETLEFTLKYDDLAYYDDGNPTGLLTTDRPAFGSGQGWTVANGTVFTATVRTNGSDADKPNQPIVGLTGQFIYGSGVLAPSVEFINATGDSVDAKFSIINTLDSTVNALYIYAVYNEGGKLVDSSIESVSVESFTSSSSVFTIGDLQEGYSVKGFIWSDAYTPLIDSVEYQVPIS
jgi:hypothetical protein